jgi:sugar phosphate isomerase/epimerase
LSIVGLKDVLINRAESDGHGLACFHWVPASQGMVNWTAVFSELARINFEGPFSVHCEYKVEQNEFMNTLKREVAFFKNKLNESPKKK